MSGRRTTVRALEGRLIESVTIYRTDENEVDMEQRGPTLEIRASGGIVFTFTAAPKVTPSAVSNLGRLRKNGDLELGDDRTFE